MIEVTKDIIKSVKLARGRYEEHLIEEREKKENNELENQKVHLMQDLNNVKGKKVTLENTIKSPFDEIMECMRLAREKDDVAYVHRGNALKRKSDELKEELNILDGVINNLEEVKRKLVCVGRLLMFLIVHSLLILYTGL